jgi:hypothetical protein
VPVGTTFTYQTTRDRLINLALKDCNALEEGEQPSAETNQDCIDKLNMIVRQLDVANVVHMWALKQQAITLLAATFLYNSSNGLPSDISEITSAVYRDSSAQDFPIDVITQDEWNRKTDKATLGDPKWVFFQQNETIGSQSLYATPMLQAVNAQSVVTGTDALTYRCIKSNTGNADTKVGNQPITSVDWPLFWELGGSSPSAWVADTQYLAPQQIRLWYKRPLFEFTSASDNPDFPQEWFRYLEYRLAHDMAPQFGVPMESRMWLKAQYKEAWDDIFRKNHAGETHHHNKILYY